MSNPIKDEFDKISLSKDISEINNIIQVFQETGFLDRDNCLFQHTHFRRFTPAKQDISEFMSH